MKKAKDAAARRWSEEKSFYAVLLLCAAAVVTAVYVLFAAPMADTTDPLDGYEYESTESITASDTLEDVPAMDASGAEETSGEAETAESATEQAAVSEAETAVEEDAEAAAAAMEFVPPAQGEPSHAYSADTLEYNETTGDWRTHAGVDYAGSEGDAVCAITDGTVTEVGEDAIWGKYVVLSHAQGLVSRYAGLEDITVSEGDSIAGGKQFASLGEPMPLEQADGVHLHMEVTRDGERIDPTELY